MTATKIFKKWIQKMNNNKKRIFKSRSKDYLISHMVNYQWSGPTKSSFYQKIKKKKEKREKNMGKIPKTTELFTSASTSTRGSNPDSAKMAPQHSLFLPNWFAYFANFIWQKKVPSQII